MGGSYPLLATMKEAPTTEYIPPSPDLGQEAQV